MPLNHIILLMRMIPGAGEERAPTLTCQYHRIRLDNGKPVGSYMKCDHPVHLNQEQRLILEDS